MNEFICPKSKHCLIFKNGLLKNKNTEDAYKNLFCKNGKEKYCSCKRYKVENAIGYCPDFVMPNSFMSLDDIIKKAGAKSIM